MNIEKIKELKEKTLKKEEFKPKEVEEFLSEGKTVKKKVDKLKKIIENPPVKDEWIFISSDEFKELVPEKKKKVQRTMSGKLKILSKHLK